MQRFTFIICLFLLVGFSSQAQNQEGVLSGNIQVDAQFYVADSLIGAQDVPEKIRSNAYGALDYYKGSFSAGVRFESYEKALIGFDPNYDGTAIANRYFRYGNELLTLTVGNFYDQFGSGLIFRAYEDRSLGIDNSVDGIHVVAKPLADITLKAFVGKQRLFFGKGPGILRGFDAEANLLSLLSSKEDRQSTLVFGSSVVSKYQEDQDPIYNLPENVSAFASRLNYIKGGLSLFSEAAYKINDPSLSNNFSYNDGKALVFLGSYSGKGYSFSAGLKRIDNMDFRSDRNASNNNLTLGFLPAFCKQHTYQLAAFYPYGTQANGEIGMQLEASYIIPKGSSLGGKYGTQVSVNYSKINTHDKTLNASDRRYSEDFFTTGDIELFQDLNIEIYKKINKNLKATLSYLNIFYDKDRIEQQIGYGVVNSHIVVADMTYSLTKKTALHTELQHLSTREDQGSWAMALVELTFSPHWYFSVVDLYNYGNSQEEKQLHYASSNIGYVTGSTRVALGYGRQRAGIICVGGVCRVLPATNGMTLSISTSF